MNKHKLKKVECNYAWRVYDVTETPDGTQMIAVAESPKPGVQIYEITAWYSKRRPPTTYYFYGTSKQHARDRFKNVMVLDLYTIREINRETERVTVRKLLSDPLRFPI